MRKSTLLACAAALLIAGHAHAQLSVSNQWIYDLDALSQSDWQALGRSFPSQMFRGSVALVFPDTSTPITDPHEVERWIVSGKPLRGVAFPGVTGDAAASWALAKQVAKANHADDGRAAPVLAVNSGWTDFGAVGGHAYELTTLRNAVNAGLASKLDPVSRSIARMLGERFEHNDEPVALIGHSAGGFYAANVAWLLEPAARQKLLVYNVGLAARMPPKTKVFQVLGKEDALAYANSSSSALTAPSTRIEGGLSHLGGEAWRLGDSMNQRRWTIAPLAKVFPQPVEGSASRAEKIAAWASVLADRARTTRALANGATHEPGGHGLVGLKLGHDARALELAHERTLAIGAWLHARETHDKQAAGAAIARTRALRSQRIAARSDLDQASRTHWRNEGLDSAAFGMSLVNEASLSLLPHNLFAKSALAMATATAFALQWGRMWTGFLPSAPAAPAAHAMHAPVVHKPVVPTPPVRNVAAMKLAPAPHQR